MNALLALDEMRASTNFNMNMAAITPFVLLMYLTKRAFQFVFYATLKLGKSREETYESKDWSSPWAQFSVNGKFILPFPDLHKSEIKLESNFLQNIHTKIHTCPV